MDGPTVGFDRGLGDFGTNFGNLIIFSVSFLRPVSHRVFGTAKQQYCAYRVC